MNIEDFLHGIHSLWDIPPQVADHPSDRRFLDVLQATDGMATENKLALLNFAAKCLSEDDVYLEIGAYHGTSIIAASLGNENRTFLTVDNFSEFAGSRAVLDKNLRTFHRHNISVVEADVSLLLAEPQPFTGRVAVYFYDGPHKYRQHWKALALIERHLADEALVIIDDASAPQVAEANRRYTRGRPQFELVLRLESPRNQEPRWWNGVDVFAYRKSRSVAPRDAAIQYSLGALRYGAGYHTYRSKVLPHVRRLGRPVKQMAIRRFGQKPNSFSSPRGTDGASREA